MQMFISLYATLVFVVSLFSLLETKPRTAKRTVYLFLAGFSLLIFIWS